MSFRQLSIYGEVFGKSSTSVQCDLASLPSQSSTTSTINTNTTITSMAFLAKVVWLLLISVIMIMF